MICTIFIIIVIGLLCYTILYLLKANIKLRSENRITNYALEKISEQLKEAMKGDTYGNFYKKKYQEAQATIQFLSMELTVYRNSNSKSHNKYDDEVKDAITYAMKRSHPDNGGCEEDFIRFNKLYEKICK